MRSKTIRSRIPAAVTKNSKEVNELYRTLKVEHDVIDIKFALGSLRGRTLDEVCEVVAAGLRTVTEGKTTNFRGLGDSYGLRAEPKVREK